MKIAFTILVITILGYVSGEKCTTNTDCVATSCNAGSQTACQHNSPDGGVTAGGGLCTCAESSTGGCVLASDCLGDLAPNLNCRDSARHCYDNTCICDRFMIGKRLA